MNKCKRCKREYNPSFEFVEEVELLETLDRYIETEDYCPDCLYELDDKVGNFILEEINEF